MAYLSETFLYSAYRRSNVLSKSMNFSNLHEARSLKDVDTVFLSHSHSDKELIEGLIQFLYESEINVYVDWNDADMPEIISRKTADNIKRRIAENKFFLVFATENALNSRWVPWEIGIADQIKNTDQIYILPIVKDNKGFKGNEYLQLYNILEIDNFVNRELFESKPKPLGYRYG